MAKSSSCYLTFQAYRPSSKSILDLLSSQYHIQKVPSTPSCGPLHLKSSSHIHSILRYCRSQQTSTVFMSNTGVRTLEKCCRSTFTQNDSVYPEPLDITSEYIGARQFYRRLTSCSFSDIHVPSISLGIYTLHCSFFHCEAHLALSNMSLPSYAEAE